ncbi:MAG: SRPBCC domain-containing protein [Chitinophagaceae bacterium]
MANTNEFMNEVTSRFVNITHTFDAPRELVFNAWTDVKQLERWYAPRGCTINFTQFNFREGGAFHSCIKSPHYHDCWCKGIYQEIIAPERIIFSMHIADEKGNLLQPKDAGMDEEWPAETIVTVTFKEYEGKTILTLRQTVAESIAKRTGAYPSWINMFDRLAEDLHIHKTSLTSI